MMSADDSRVAQAPVAPGTRVRSPLVGMDRRPIGADHWPCNPIPFYLIELDDLVVYGSSVCRVINKTSTWINLVHSPYYRDSGKPFYEWRYSIHSHQEPILWKYDIGSDLAV